VTLRADNGEIQVAMVRGEGILIPDADCSALPRHGGCWPRAIDLSIIQALGIAGVDVRKPSVRVARVGGGRRDVADAVADRGADAVAADGSEPVVSGPSADVEALLSGGCGETAVFELNSRPVRPIPRRLDAALAVWRLIGWNMLRRLTGGVADEPSRQSPPLMAKVASAVGASELVLVRRVVDGLGRWLPNICRLRRVPRPTVGLSCRRRVKVP
jgi:hypothetical protein